MSTQLSITRFPALMRLAIILLLLVTQPDLPRTALSAAADPIRPPLAAPASSPATRMPEAPSARSNTTLTYTPGGAAGYLWYMGGYTPWATAEVDRFDIGANTWTANIPTLPQPTFGACAAFLPADDTIYVTGGSNEFDANLGIQAYHLSDNSWSTDYDPIPSSVLPHGLEDHGCGVLDNRIFLFAGQQPFVFNYSNLTLVFDPHQPRGQQWTILPYRLSEKRLSPAYAADPVTHKLYTVGGVIRSGFDVTDSATVESFSPDTGWTRLPDLPQALGGGALYLANHGQRLVFAAGGVHDSSNRILTCDLPGCAWQTNRAHLQTARSFAGFSQSRDHLYIVGGDYEYGFILLSSAEQVP